MRADALQQLRQVIHLAVVQPAGRLVQHQQLRPADQRARQFDALLRAERQAAGQVPATSSQIEQIQQIVQPRDRDRVLPPHHRQAQRIGDEAGAAEMMRADQDVVAHAHAAEQRDVLEGAADAQAGHAVARQVLQRAALEQDVAVGEAIEAADAVEQRGLAGAVRPDQAADLAVADIERHAAECDDAAEAHRHVGNPEQRSVGGLDRHQAARACVSANPPGAATASHT